MQLPQIRDLIQRDNPTARVDDVELYARQFMTYLEAAENIEKNGTIVLHPRTGQPMENPYVKVRTAAQSSMQKMKRLRKLNLLWTEAKHYLDRIAVPETAPKLNGRRPKSPPPENPQPLNSAKPRKGSRK